MTGGLSTQVKVNVKPIGAFKSGLIRQVVFERRGLKIQGPLYSNNKTSYHLALHVIPHGYIPPPAPYLAGDTNLNFPTKSPLHFSQLVQHPTGDSMLWYQSYNNVSEMRMRQLRNHIF